MDQGANNIELTPVHCPRGYHPVKVDAAGRVKLPAQFRRYIETRADRTLLFTILQDFPRIFTNGSFQGMLGAVEKKDTRRKIKDSADMDGENVELDPQGRITLPTAHRKRLGLEDCTIWLRYNDDVISIFNEEQYAARRAAIDAQKREIDALAIDGGFEL